MLFGSPYNAYIFVLIALLFVFYLISDKRKRKSAAVFAQKELLSGLMPVMDNKRRRLRLMMFFAALSLCALSLMRPQFGLQIEQEKRSGLDIIIAIDTSKSMLTEDVKPNRLEFAKTAVRNLVGKLKGDRIGLIAFSGNAFMVCPLTVDYNGFMLSLDSLDKDTIPKGGTTLSHAIKESIKGFKNIQKQSKALILITDGEDHGGEGDAAEAAKAAQKEGVTIFTIGVGTAEGDLLATTGQDGHKAFIKDRQGNVIKSRLEEKILQQIASNGGGDYIRLGEPGSDMQRLYEDNLSRIEKREMEKTARKQLREWFQLPLALALLLILAEPLISENKKTG